MQAKKQLGWKGLVPKIQEIAQSGPERKDVQGVAKCSLKESSGK